MGLKSVTIKKLLRVIALAKMNGATDAHEVTFENDNFDSFFVTAPVEAAPDLAALLAADSPPAAAK